MASTAVSLTGNLTRDPELRFTASGKSVVNLDLACNRTDTKEGKGETEFFRVVAWDSLADNITASLVKGMRVTVSGRLRYDTWRNENDELRSRVIVTAESVGPDLRWQTAVVTKVSNNGQSSIQIIEEPSEDIFA